MLAGYRGHPVARVHLAPALLVHRVAAELRAAAPGPAEEPAPRWQAIARAGELFARAELGGCSPEEHCRQVTLATGAPVACSRRAMAELSAGLIGVREALRWQAPGGNLTVFATRRRFLPDGRVYAWVPTGRVLGLVAPANHPGVHLTWVLALAMGWSVLVRPGRDDPLTPWRLILALAAAGFPADRVALLPGGHDLVPAMVEACDRTVAYGGPTLGQFLGRDGRVRFHGPGSSKVLIDAPADPEAAAAFLMEAICHDGGRKCTCASGVLVRGKVPGLLDDLAGRLAALPLLDPLDPAARVPVWKGAVAAPAPARTTVRDGLTFLQPELVVCPEPGRPPFGLELPAPWATAAELPPGADPLPLLRGSLAVTLLSRDRGLAEAALAEPTIQKVFTGAVPPWHSEPGAPHQGRLAEFLFTSKAWREEELPWS